MWTPEDRALVGDFGSGQTLSNDQYRLIEPFIPPPKPGGRPRTTKMGSLQESMDASRCKTDDGVSCGCVNLSGRFREQCRSGL